MYIVLLLIPKGKCAAVFSAAARKLRRLYLYTKKSVKH